MSSNADQKPSETPAPGTDAAAPPKAVVKNVDMSEEMQQAAVDIANEALAKFTVEKDIAAHVKRTMDSRFGPSWHAVVGKNYGSYVTHGECMCASAALGEEKSCCSWQRGARGVAADRRALTRQVQLSQRTQQQRTDAMYAAFSLFPTNRDQALHLLLSVHRSLLIAL